MQQTLPLSDHTAVAPWEARQEPGEGGYWRDGTEHTIEIVRDPQGRL